MICVGEVDFVQIRLRSAPLEFPRFSAIERVYNLTELPNDPTDMSINKVSGVEFVVTVAILSLPCHPTVLGMKDNTGPTHDPSLCLVEEKDAFNHFVEVAGGLLCPRFTTICRMEHSP